MWLPEAVVASQHHDHHDKLFWPSIQNIVIWPWNMPTRILRIWRDPSTRVCRLWLVHVMSSSYNFHFDHFWSSLPFSWLGFSRVAADGLALKGANAVVALEINLNHLKGRAEFGIVNISDLIWWTLFSWLSSWKCHRLNVCEVSWTLGSQSNVSLTLTGLRLPSCSVILAEIPKAFWG